LFANNFVRKYFGSKVKLWLLCIFFGYQCKTLVPGPNLLALANVGNLWPVQMLVYHSQFRQEFALSVRQISAWIPVIALDLCLLILVGAITFLDVLGISFFFFKPKRNQQATSCNWIIMLLCGWMNLRDFRLTAATTGWLWLRIWKILVQCTDTRCARLPGPQGYTCTQSPQPAATQKLN